MTEQELINIALTVYDEYHPQQAVDEDLKEMVKTFIKRHINEFLCMLPSNCLNDDIVVNVNHQDVANAITLIDYRGICLDLTTLEKKFLKLVSFKLDNWERAVYAEDVINSDNPRRKLQENKYTSGKVSRPVVSIENVRGKKSLCAWGYTGTDYNVNDFTYIRELDSIEDFLTLPDYLLTAYIYYVLFYLFNTVQEIRLAENSLMQMQSLLSLHQIYPVMPVEFQASNEKKKSLKK